MAGFQRVLGVSLAALLVRLAKSDNQYDESEQIRIEHVLAVRRGLGHAEATDLRLRAEQVEAEAPDTVRFTRALKEKIAYSDRSGVIEALWEVALADGTREANEEAVIRLAASLLGVSDRDSALAPRLRGDTPLPRQWTQAPDAPCSGSILEETLFPLPAH